MMEHMDDNEGSFELQSVDLQFFVIIDGVITFDEFILVKGIDIEDESDGNKIQLQLGWSFTKRPKNNSGGVEILPNEISVRKESAPWNKVERRSFDNKDINLNGALEGSELDAYI